MTFFLDDYDQFKWSFTLVDSQLISIAYMLLFRCHFCLHVAYMSVFRCQFRLCVTLTGRTHRQPYLTRGTHPH